MGHYICKNTNCDTEVTVDCEICERNVAGNQISYSDSLYICCQNLTGFLQILTALSLLLRVRSLVRRDSTTRCRLSPLASLLCFFHLSSVNTSFFSSFPLYCLIHLFCIVSQTDYLLTYSMEQSPS